LSESTGHESRQDHLEAMHAFARILEQDLDMESVLRKALAGCLEAFRCGRVWLAYPADPEPGQFRFRFQANRQGMPAIPENREHALGPESLACLSAILASPDPIVSSGEKGDGGHARPGTRGFRNIPTLALAIRPRLGRPWVISLQDPEPERAWSRWDRGLLRDLGGSLAFAIGNLMRHRNLHDSEDRYRWFVDNTAERIWRFDLKKPMPPGLSRERQITWFYEEAVLAEGNRAMASFYGYPDAACILGKGLTDFLTDRGPSTAAFLGRFIQSGYRLLDAESMERDVAGSIRYSLNNLVGIRENGMLTGVWGTARDITENRLQEIELRRSRDQREAILQGIADAIVVTDGEGKVMYLNDAAARLMGFPSRKAGDPSAGGLEMADLETRFSFLDEAGRPLPPDAMPMRTALAGSDFHPRLLRIRTRPPGPERWVMAQSRRILDPGGKIAFAIGIMQDLTDLKTAQDRLRQSEKMEAIGQLAGGIAHDFNNLLTAINGYAQLAMSRKDLPAGLREFLEEIAKAGGRAAGLTAQLLAYSRKAVLQPRQVDLNAVLADMQNLLRRIIGVDIRLEHKPGPDLGLVKVDPSQLGQVIFNLAVNARDAMPRGGRLVMETGNALLSDSRDEGIRDAPPGEYVYLTVRDNGIGMPPETRKKIFEPFFTTKRDGKGTGLGLSSVYGIIKQSGGFITVRSSNGRGTAFRIYLPRFRAGSTQT